MIESINLKNVASYDASGITFNNLKKVNFVYGVNGSGKTTISNLLSDPQNSRYNACTVNWKSGLALRTLVYNKEFREKNFGKGHMDGVFTLGQATKEDIELIEQKVILRQQHKEEWQKRKATLEKKQSELATHHDNFKEVAWQEIYKKHEKLFKEAFAGYMTKENFKNKIVEEFKTNAAPLLNLQSLSEKAKIIFGTVPVGMTHLSSLEYLDLLEIETDNIWQKKIIGKADVEIGKLIQRLNINDWINEGRGYIQDDSTCPFCQQPTINKSLRNQLDEYFDEAFVNDTTKVKSFADSYNRLANNLLNLLKQIEESENARLDSKLQKELFSAYLKTFDLELLSNREILNNKIKEPSRSFSLVSIKNQLEQIDTLLKSANTEITRHNVIVSNYAKEKQELIKSIWRFLVDEHKITLQNFLSTEAALEKAISGINEGVKNEAGAHNALKQEIINLSNNVTSVQPSIDQINLTLKAYGFSNFQIVPTAKEKNKYQIHRNDGTIADSTLSEGEVTFITFLYFLQLTKGGYSESTITEDRILVIDDPISSLDSNVLYVVSALVKEIIKKVKINQGNIKQIVLLTHNIFFHKEVSFIDGRTKDCNNTSYWILRKNDSVTTVQFFGKQSPIQSSYEILWMELKNRKQVSGLTIQNTMRRIIEHYFKILGKMNDEQIIEQFDVYQEKEICRSLLCWINDGSHTIPDDLFIENQSDAIDRFFEVFKKIFVHAKHEQHYLMMMGEVEAA